ncbi:helix-turn-helix domain-containing protein [Natronosporangium hydrolyticum]|uniref:helix-turn-helix domain-containing protein n=1 Tax=Natronosporangium hydrolyticum TaxID=2811111 RepID=UPI001EFA111F|nr:helix-turn-helix transcriptional regulator [Natronosporangium hydrolyticum]
MPGRVTTGSLPARPRERTPAPRPLLRSVLGWQLRRTRQEQERTLAEVAAAARVSMAYLSEVERGRKEASSEVLAAVCDALDVDLADLLTEVGRGLATARNTHVAGESQARLGATPQARLGAGRSGTVVRLDDFRGRRARQVPLPRGRRLRGPGEVELLRAA